MFIAALFIVTNRTQPGCHQQVNKENMECIHNGVLLFTIKENETLSFAAKKKGTGGHHGK